VDESLMRDELKQYPIEAILLKMQTSIIDKDKLKELLVTKTCGDVKSIVQQLEKMFVLRGLYAMLSVNFDHCEEMAVEGIPPNEVFEKLRTHQLWANLKSTKLMPKWWNEEWDIKLLKGTLIYGWGGIPEEWVLKHGFTKEYDIVKRLKPKPSTLPLKNTTNETNGVSIQDSEEKKSTVADDNLKSSGTTRKKDNGLKIKNKRIV